MISKGLLVRLEAQHGKDAEVADFLRSAVAAVQSESGTRAWFAVQFGRSQFGIVDFFESDDARDAHLSGAVAEALTQRSDELFAQPPDIRKIDVLANKLPPALDDQPLAKGVLFMLKAKQGHESQLRQFLMDARALVMDEEGTVAWFAQQLDDGHYAIFDVFADNGGRFAHLTGQVPRELTKHALSLLGGLPDIGLLDVLAHSAKAAETAEPGADEIRQGGTEDLMVSGNGGTLPLKGFDPPDYYSKDKARASNE